MGAWDLKKYINIGQNTSQQENTPLHKERPKTTAYSKAATHDNTAW
jgi:hypothetical protein